MSVLYPKIHQPYDPYISSSDSSEASSSDDINQNNHNMHRALTHNNSDNCDSDHDEENTLLSQISSAHSHASSLSYISQSRKSLCCNFHSNSNNSISHQSASYTKSRKALHKLLKSKKAKDIIENELERERSKGRYLLLTCICMSILVGFMFADRWPEDWRGALIDLLEKGRSGNGNSSNLGNNGVKDPLEAFRNRDKKNEDNDDDDGSTSATSGTLDDDDHYSKYGSTYDKYKATHHKSSASHSNNNSNNNNNNNSPTYHKPTQQDLIEENEQQHIDNLSKYLKWNLPYKRDRDIPVYWHVPLTGTELVDEILAKCYNLVQAADDVNLLMGHEKDNILNVVTVDSSGTGSAGKSKRYINVDMGSISGIKRAKELHLARSGVVEVIRTSYLYETDLLFENTAKYGKCFTLIRDPIQRSIDVFYKLKEYSKNVVFKSMTLDEYVKSSYVEDNWMVRVLSNEMEGELKQQHLELAQHVLGRKFIVGLAEDFEESVRRFAKYFHWDEAVSKEDVQKCKDGLEIAKRVKDGTLTYGSLGPSSSNTEMKVVKEGDEIYKILEQKNMFDIQLYKYAKGLYLNQALYSRHILF